MILCAFCKKLDISLKVRKKEVQSFSLQQHDDNVRMITMVMTAMKQLMTMLISAKTLMTKKILEKRFNLVSLAQYSRLQLVPATIPLCQNSLRLLLHIYAVIRSICIGFNDGFVYTFSLIVLKYSTIHPEQVLYNAIYKILPGDRRCDIHQLTCKSSRKKCHLKHLNSVRVWVWTLIAPLVDRDSNLDALFNKQLFGFFPPSVFCAVGWCRAHVPHGDYLLCVLSHLVCLGCTVAHSGQGTEGWRHSLG